MTCPDPNSHYKITLDRGRLDLKGFQQEANDLHAQGYDLHQVFEQGGNTIKVYRHSHP